MTAANFLGGAVLLTLLSACLYIPALYYAFRDEKSSCQQGTRGGLNLSDWLKGYGFEKLAVNVLIIIFAVLYSIRRMNAYLYAAMFIIIADIIFTVIWNIWGIVVLATNENSSCVSEGKGMAVMAVIALCIGLVPSLVETNSEKR